MKKKQNRASQRLSGKTYLAMDEETKLKIEALYACYSLNSHQIGDIVNWPWQSCSKHIKVMNDRIEYGKTTFEKLEEQGEQTIAKYGLDMFVNGIPEVPKEALVVEPEQLAEEFPEIIQPTHEQASTESEISVPTSEDVANGEEKGDGSCKITEREADALEELVLSVRDAIDKFDNECPEIRNETPEQWGKKFEASAIREGFDGTDEKPGQESTSIAKCRICGCDDLHACEEGCYWVEDDLCSKCAQNLEEENDKRVRKDAPFYLTIQNLLDRYEAGEITFDGMILDESQGIFRIQYATA